MDKYECLICGYIYDPAENDNVAFDDLPKDWTCPVCGVDKNQFKKLQLKSAKHHLDLICKNYQSLHTRRKCWQFQVKVLC